MRSRRYTFDCRAPDYRVIDGWIGLSLNVAIACWMGADLRMFYAGG